MDLQNQASQREVIFVCFATDDLAQSRDNIVRDARALRVFTKVEVWDEARLHSQPEWATLPDSIKAARRGHGYFWWKPFLIRKALDDAEEGDLVFYSDCGRYDGGFRLGPELIRLIARYEKEGFVGVEVPQFGPSARWTKMDCLEGLSSDITRHRELPQIQATFSLWKKTKDTMTFVESWESACRNPSWISDCTSVSENDPRFVDHRHDQSILTLLARSCSRTYISVVAPWERPFIHHLSRLHESNVCFKQVGFVEQAARSRSVLLLLFLKYARRKCQEIVRRFSLS